MLKVLHWNVWAWLYKQCITHIDLGNMGLNLPMNKKKNIFIKMWSDLSHTVIVLATKHQRTWRPQHTHQITRQPMKLAGQDGIISASPNCIILNEIRGLDTQKLIKKLNHSTGSLTASINQIAIILYGCIVNKVSALQMREYPACLIETEVTPILCRI